MGRWHVRVVIGLILFLMFRLSASAAAIIVPGQAIAGVRLWMTETQVRTELGRPLRVTRTHGALGFVVTTLHYAGLVVDLERLDRKPVVIRVWTTRRSERTAAGLGVGSPMSAVAKLPGARCWSEVGGTRYCVTGKRNNRLGRFTIFDGGRRGRVTSIGVSLVVNS